MRDLPMIRLTRVERVIVFALHCCRGVCRGVGDLSGDGGLYGA